MKYLIWSVEHCGWWKRSRHGYTSATHRAGLFSEEEARAICAKANGHLMPDAYAEFMVPAPPPVQIDNDQTCDLETWQIAERIGRVDFGLAGQLGRSMAENAKLKAEIAEAKEVAHYANGTAELAMKHRDVAEEENARLKELLRVKFTERQ